MRIKNTSVAIRISVITIILNLLLSALKFTAGIVSHSSAMISDAINSTSDIFFTSIVIIGVKLSGRASDKDHPYGHERMECVAAIILSVILFIVGIGVGYDGMLKIFSQSPGGLEAPGFFALVAAVISIAVKAVMSFYTSTVAKRINSSALLADAMNHKSDILSSIGGFIGIMGARLGLPIMDPIASVVICLFIIKAAVDVFRDAVSKITDKACDDEVVEAIKELVLRQKGVLGIDQLKTRLFGSRIYVDVDIRVNRDTSLENAHRIAQVTHDAIELSFPLVKHCMVHVNPEKKNSG